MMAQQAFSSPEGAKYRKIAATIPIVENCSRNSPAEALTALRSATKYPRIQEDTAMNGRPGTRIRSGAAAASLPSRSAAIKSAPSHSAPPETRLSVPLHRTHFRTAFRPREGLPDPAASATSRVTARLIPEVHTVTASRNTEEMS